MNPTRKEGTQTRGSLLIITEVQVDLLDLEVVGGLVKVELSERRAHRLVLLIRSQRLRSSSRYRNHL